MKQKKFYTCKYDKAFKEIMMKKENFSILKKVLENILEIEIKEIELRPLNLNTNNIYVKGKETDLLILTNQGKIEIEVNNHYEDYVRVRNFCYITNIYQNEITEGEQYKEKIDIIQINLNYGVKDKEYKRIYKMRDEKGKEYIKNCIIYEINMDKYKELLYNNNKEGIEKNKYLLMLDMGLEELEKYKTDRVVKEYMEKMERLNQNPMFINWITKEKDEQMILNTRLSDAEERGITKGVNLGIKQGINQGITQGIEKANIEMTKKMKKMVKNMIEKNIPLEQISEITGLDKKEIQKLNK